jgi:hypothetical protein
MTELLNHGYEERYNHPDRLSSGLKKKHRALSVSVPQIGFASKVLLIFLKEALRTSFKKINKTSRALPANPEQAEGYSAVES